MSIAEKMSAAVRQAMSIGPVRERRVPAVIQLGVYTTNAFFPIFIPLQMVVNREFFRRSPSPLVITQPTLGQTQPVCCSKSACSPPNY